MMKNKKKSKYYSVGFVEMCGDVWRFVEMCGDVWRCVEICGDILIYIEYPKKKKKIIKYLLNLLYIFNIK